MIPKRVTFELVDLEDANLLTEFGAAIREHILLHGDEDAESFPIGYGLTAFLTSIPKPVIGRIMARWFFRDSDEAIVTGLRTGDAAIEIPPTES